MVSPETGKSRSQRISLDYFRQRDSFTIRRRWLVLCALGLTGAYAAWAVVSESRGSDPADSGLRRLWGRQVSTGPLANPHASFETDCAACHGTGLTHPLAQDAWRRNDTAVVAHIEKSCSTAGCHLVAHHFIDTLKPAAQLLARDCIACHQDHLGRNHDLVDIPDTACGRCHARLSAHLASPGDVRDRIDSFSPRGHGDFASLKSHPDGIRFSHYQHLQPGQVVPAEDGSTNLAGFRVDNLPEKYQERYRVSSQVEGWVQLSCEDCHQLTSQLGVTADFAADSQQAAHYAPIDFEQHCEACHALNYAGQTGPLQPLPHAACRAEVAVILRSKIEGGRRTGSIRMPSDTTRSVAVPGKGVGSSGENVHATDTEINALLDELLVKCRQCHWDEHLEPMFVEQAAEGRSTPLIPTRWLRRGSFDHSAHIRMDCRFCHAGVFERQGSQSLPDHTTVMIAGIASCTPCHRSAESAPPPEIVDGTQAQFLQRYQSSEQLVSATLLAEGGQPTWASASCTTCHRYHWTRPTGTQGVGP